MHFPSNFGCKIIFMCSVNFWHQQVSNSSFKGSIGHVTSECNWPIALSFKSFIQFLPVSVPRALPPRAEHLVPRALPPRAEHLVPRALKKDILNKLTFLLTFFYLPFVLCCFLLGSCFPVVFLVVISWM